jgi:hypothetical protein
METIRISGIEVKVDPKGNVWLKDELLGSLSREERLGQFFWRATPASGKEPLKRFLTTRPEAIQLLLINADVIDGIGF